MHHIFVHENYIDNVNGIITIDKISDKENYNHLANVLRVNNGEKVLCSIIPFNMSFDYLCSVVSVDNSIVLKIEEKQSSKELIVQINLYQALCKSDKLEFIIEKAVELGVTNIIPVDTKHCVAKIDAKKENTKIERYNKIAKSAAEQSKRNIIPKVLSYMTYNAMLDKIDSECKTFGDKVLNILFYENAKGIKYTRDVIRSFTDKMNEKKLMNDAMINVIIGPEGGFAKEEIELAKMRGFNILSLGDRILRAETAAVTALSILMYELQ